MLYPIIRTIIASVVALAIALLVYCLLAEILFIPNADAAAYNDGICTNCGGQYKYASTTVVNHAERWYYVCNECDHVIKLYNQPAK